MSLEYSQQLSQLSPKTKGAWQYTIIFFTVHLHYYNPRKFKVVQPKFFFSPTGRLHFTMRMHDRAWKRPPPFPDFVEGNENFRLRLLIWWQTEKWTRVVYLAVYSEVYSDPIYMIVQNSSNASRNRRLDQWRQCRAVLLSTCPAVFRDVLLKFPRYIS